MLNIFPILPNPQTERLWRNKHEASSNKKLLGTSASLLGTSALLLVTRSFQLEQIKPNLNARPRLCLWMDWSLIQCSWRQLAGKHSSHVQIAGLFFGGFRDCYVGSRLVFLGSLLGVNMWWCREVQGLVWGIFTLASSLVAYLASMSNGRRCVCFVVMCAVL